MALAFAGNGTITGLSVGGLPDGCIQASDLASGVGGKVLQVVSTAKTDTYTTSTNSWGDVTGMSVSLTPSSGTKCLVIIHINNSCNVTSYGGGRIVRDSTAIAIGDASGSKERCTWNFYQTTNNGMDYSSGMNFLDTHGADGSTAVTYKLQMRAWDSYAVYLNRTVSDSSDTGHARTASSITVMEISA
tara:strand:+ start:7 stop:570 length:564 start_codon:yes stop_codon:yes gene_type:complete